MDKLNGLLSTVLRKKGLYDEATASLITHLAQGWIVAELPHIASALCVTGFRDGLLSIEAKNSIASQECSISRESFLTFLKVQCPAVIIREIRIARAQ